MTTNHGLLHTACDIGSGLLGTVDFYCACLFDTVHRTVTTGRITQPVSPPLSVITHLHGSWVAMIG